MISPEKVRRDLKDIRYYYARKAILDSVKGDVGINKVRSMVDRYNKMILNAPLYLFDLYVCLYVKGYTQDKMAVELNVSSQYVHSQNKKLVEFLQSHYDHPFGEEESV
jgi:hypothetical protein